MTYEELDSILTAPAPSEQLRPGQKAFSHNYPDLTTAPKGFPGRIQVCRYPRLSEIPVSETPQQELLYVYAGSCALTVGGNPMLLEQGQALLMEQQVHRTISPLRQGDIVLGFRMTQEYIRELFLSGPTSGMILTQQLQFFYKGNLRRENSYFFPMQENHRLRDLLMDITIELIAPRDGSEDVVFYSLALVQCCFGRYYRDNSRSFDGQEMNPRILPILNYIARRYPTVTLKETADHFHLNPNYLSGLLREKLGCTFQELVIRHRMRSAKDLLLHSELPVTEIARQVGYDNTSFFYRKFKEFTGKSPSDYRKDV